jgi:hypothetical protein
MALRRAVPKTPPRSPVPPRSLIHKPRILSTSSESTLPQLLISTRFNPSISNVYEKPQGRPPPLPQGLSTRHYRLPAHATHTRTATTPIPSMCYGQLSVYLRTACTPSGTANPGCRSSAFRATFYGQPPWATAPLLRTYRCAAARKVPESRLLLLPAKPRETYPPPAVSNTRRADIGFGIRRLPNPVARRSRNTGSHEQEGLGPTF